MGTEFETQDGKRISLKVGVYEEEFIEEVSESVQQGVLSEDEDKGIYYVINAEMYRKRSWSS